MPHKKLTPPVQAARSVIESRGGVVRTAEAIRAGIHPRTLYAMRDAGLLRTISRGLYRLADLPPLGNPDLVAVAKRAPDGVICLISALSFHELTTQIPHEVYMALARGKARPRIEYPPIRVFWFSGNAFSEGIEIHQIDNLPVRIYSPEKTLADIFRYRNDLGMETAIEALRMYHQKGKVKIDALMRCARACRVERIMRPYLEATL